MPSLRTIMQMPDVTAKLNELGVRRQAMTPAQFADFVRREHAKYQEIGKRASMDPHPEIADPDVANPFSIVLSAAQLLGWHGQRTDAGASCAAMTAAASCCDGR